MRAFLSMLVALALGACGGGGGGNTASPVTSPGSGGSPTGVTINYDEYPANIGHYEGEGPSFFTVKATASGTSTQDVLITAQVSGTGIATPVKINTDTATRTATIIVTAAEGLAPGTYTGTLTIKACADAACSVQHGGSPHNVNYTVTVKPALNVKGKQVFLAAVETGTSQPASFDFNPLLANSGVTATIGYYSPPGTDGWLSAAISGNTVQLQASAGNLPPGDYSTSVSLAVPGTFHHQEVPVSLHVDSGMSVPAGADVQVTNSTPAAQLQGQVALVLAPGTNATTWYAASDKPWLQLDAASGPFGTNPVWRIDTALFNALPNNATHDATVTISANSTLKPKTFIVHARKAVAEIKGLDTLALLAGEGGDLLVYGSNFTSLPAGTAAVTVAGTTPSAVSVLSDSVLRVTLPALQAGSYAVTANSVNGMTNPGKTMHVTARVAYEYQALALSAASRIIVWDALTRSAYVGAHSTVTRFGESAGTFTQVASRNFSGGINAIGIGRDHGALIVQRGTINIEKLLPADLSTISTFTIGPPPQYGGSSIGWVPLAIMGDNHAMLQKYGWVDIDTGSTSPFKYSVYADTTYLTEWAAVSGDGARIMHPPHEAHIASTSMYRMDLVTGIFEPYDSGTRYFNTYAANHTGTKWALGRVVVDFDLNILGNVTLPEGWIGSRYAFSRNGSRLYHYAQVSPTNPTARIYVFDTSQAVGASATFPVIGYIDLPDAPNAACAVGDNWCDYFNTPVAITDDDLTLFVGGTRKLLVVPVPAGLRSAASAQGASLSGQARLPGLP